MPATPLRAAALSALATLALAGAGLIWEFVRYGPDDRATLARVERDVQRRFAGRVGDVQRLAERVARESARVAAAVEDLEALPPLFARLRAVARDQRGAAVSATVLVPTGPARLHRVLAWSDGPAEGVDLERLTADTATFVAPGTLGLRLVHVRLLVHEETRLGYVAAETVLSPTVPGGNPSGEYPFATAFGPVSIATHFPGAGDARPGPDRFVVPTPDGQPALEVSASTAGLADSRALFRRRVLALAALPLLLAALLATGPILDRRGRAADAAGFLTWSLAAAVVVAACAASLVALGRLARLPAALEHPAGGLAALALTVLLPVSWWWRRRRRRRPDLDRPRFVAEQLAAGGLLAALLGATAWLLDAWIGPDSVDLWQFPLFRLSAARLLWHAGLLLLQLALAWAMAAALACQAERWRVSWKRPGRAGGATALWLAPVAAFAWIPHPAQPVPAPGLLVAAASVALFALAAGSLRRVYRHATQAARLLLVFAALLAPAVALYPAAAFRADATARALVEHDYAPALAGHPRSLIDAVERTTAEIDGLDRSLLAALAGTSRAPGAPIPTQAAFHIWRQTELSRARLTSAIELYGPDGSLVSRFALNVPEYREISEARTYVAARCEWELFGEVTRFGAIERHMLHAERGLCDAGPPAGAIVVHVVPDPRALPFIASGNPYADALVGPAGAPGPAGLRRLEVAIYGWNFQPLFTSGSIAWPISPGIFARLYASREAFWAALEAKGRRYRVFFANDRAGVYALGLPAATPFDHLTRLAEAAALTGVVALALLVGATFYAPWSRRRRAPLRAVYVEIRTSFYRKLFLFFVLAAVGPVVLVAAALGTYMATRFRADVEAEAASTVTVARRVLEEMAAAIDRPGQPQTVLPDDVMVLIGQVIDENVNLYQGSELVSTSQRDLFDSGLLPTRTPSAVYQAVALDRLPAFVTEDRLGAFRYLLAAAPVPIRGRDAVLSVPLALRQREIDREVEDLNRGVLVGAIFVLLFAAGLGASVARRIADPVARLTRATRQIAAGRLDVRIVADTADELRRLVDDFNSMAATLAAQRAELARTHQFKAWAEMARQVAHEIKNPLTPIQLAAEHLQRVHADRRAPLGPVFDQCLTTILRQVRMLRRIASEFANFAGEPRARPARLAPAELIRAVLEPYRAIPGDRIAIAATIADGLPAIHADRTLLARAFTNVIENALQAMPDGGRLDVHVTPEGGGIRVTFADTGVGMDAASAARAFEPYFSTKTAGSGLGLANARRNIELAGGTIELRSAPAAGTTVTVRLPGAPPAGRADG